MANGEGNRKKNANSTILLVQSGGEALLCLTYVDGRPPRETEVTPG